jgi:hypothetical protein
MNFVSFRRQDSAGACTAAHTGPNQSTFSAAGECANSSTNAGTTSDNGSVALLC